MALEKVVLDEDNVANKRLVHDRDAHFKHIRVRVTHNNKLNLQWNTNSIHQFSALTFQQSTLDYKNRQIDECLCFVIKYLEGMG